MRYFTKCPIIVLLVCIFLLPAEGAPSKAAESELPALSDRQVLRYLSTAETLEWERAQEQLKAGQSQVETGTRLMNRPPSMLSSSEQVAQDKKAGAEQVALGEATIAQANKVLDGLRAKAAEEKAGTKVVKHEPVTIPMEYSATTLDDGLMPTTEKLLFQLWNQGYSRIYLDQAYVIDTADKNPIYLSDPLLTKELRGIIARLDGNRFTFVNDEAIQFKLVQEGGHSYIDFPDREPILRNFKSVLVLAEIVYDSRMESALLSLRGIDLKSDIVVASELISLVVDDSVRTMVPKAEPAETAQNKAAPASKDTTHPTEVAEGETPAPAPVKEEAPVESTAPESVAEQPVSPASITKRLAVQLKDNNNFLARVSASGTPYVFTFEYVGDAKGFNSRAASMISKVILLSQNLNVSDDDFLVLALGQGDVEPDSTTGHTNALWKVTPLGSAGQGRSAYDIQAVSLISSQPSSVPVGLMQTALIQENAPVGGS